MGLRCASPDYETTGQQDNEWRLRKATLVLRQTTRLRVNETTSGASQGFAGVSPDYETTSNRFAKATLSFADNETTSQRDYE